MNLNSILINRSTPDRSDLNKYEPKTKIPKFQFEPNLPSDFSIPKWANDKSEINQRLVIQNHGELKVYFKPATEIDKYIHIMFPEFDIPSSPNTFSKYIMKNFN